jgi:hypothetical protein
MGGLKVSTLLRSTPPVQVCNPDPCRAERRRGNASPIARAQAGPSAGRHDLAGLEDEEADDVCPRRGLSHRLELFLRIVAEEESKLDRNAQGARIVDRPAEVRLPVLLARTSTRMVEPDARRSSPRLDRCAVARAEPERQPSGGPLAESILIGSPVSAASFGLPSKVRCTRCWIPGPQGRGEAPEHERRR